jgi:hypothetical protein
MEKREGERERERESDRVKLNPLAMQIRPIPKDQRRGRRKAQRRKSRGSVDEDALDLPEVVGANARHARFN